MVSFQELISGESELPIAVGHSVSVLLLEVRES